MPRTIVFSRLKPMKKWLHSGLLLAYRATQATGIFSTSLGKGIFDRIYDKYKTIFEAPYIAELRPFIKPGTSVIDVGAFQGFFSLRFGRWVTDGGKVIAIEPEPSNFFHLCSVVKKNKLQEVVETIQVAIAEKSGDLFLEINPFYPVDHKLGSEGVPVKGMRLDDVMNLYDWPLVSLIKIDVQGGEAKVIEGASQTIGRFKPTILMEVDTLGLKRYGSSSRALLETLVNLGYTIHHLERASISPPLSVTEAEMVVSVDKGLKERSLKQGRVKYADFLFISKN